jgi:hypothetical protein
MCPPPGSECPASSIVPCPTDQPSPNPDGGPTGPPAQCCDYSPILIDLQGDGFSLTDAHNGVLFDFNGDGLRSLFSWTSAGSDDAWLALDRNGNSVIDDAFELFGNYTEQPPSSKPNGFLALAEYDRTERGGNSDGVIDAGDSVYDRLRLWRDENHNGVSEPGELRVLPSQGVESLSLDYRESWRRDRHGNLFRFRAKVTGGGGVRPGRWAYDVFLLSGR